MSAPSTPADDRSLSAPDWAPIRDPRAKDLALLASTKCRARSDLGLGEWARQGHAWRPPLEEPPPLGAIPRLPAASLSPRDFVARFEAPNLPVLIGGLAGGWPAWAARAWAPGALHGAYRSRRFRCGEDDKGRPVKLKLKHFLRYMKAQRDDSPLYVFDSMYNDDRTPSRLLAEYAVPPHFGEDLLALVGEHRRPPYRWMLLGPVRSGTGVHIDPLATSAWNTLLHGRKRWVLFEPGFSKAEVKGREFVREGEDDEPIDYFLNVLPRLKAARGPALTARMLEFTQRAGETIFVPGGWWHAVLNLEDTVAVTQNFCSTTNFDAVWAAAAAGRRGMARKWLRALRAARPDLAARAEAHNEAVGWREAALAAAHRQRKAAVLAAREARRAARRAARAAARSSGGGGGGGRGVVADSSDGSSSSSSDGTSTSSGSVTSLSSLSSAEQRRRRAAPSGGGGGSSAAAPAAAAGEAEASSKKKKKRARGP
jgi:histone arginine demethylase JMJD6